MTDFKKFKIKNQSIRGLLSSGLITLITVISLSLIATLILSSTESSSNDIRIYSLAVLVASAFLSGFINSKIGGIRQAIFTGLFISLLMLLLGIILSGGKLSGGAFMNYGCFFLVSAGAAYIGRKREKKQRRHRR